MRLYLNFDITAKFNPYSDSSWRDYSNAILDDGFERKQSVGAKGKTEQQTVSMRLKAIVGVENLAMNIMLAPTDIRARLTLDDGTPYFIGYIRPRPSLKVTSSLDSVDVEIIDDSYLLEYKQVEDDNCFFDSSIVEGKLTLAYLLRWIISKAQAVSSATLGPKVYSRAIPESDIVIPTSLGLDGLRVYPITIEGGTKINDILSAVCYEFNLQYRFRPDGKIVFMEALPKTLAGTEPVLNDSDIRGGLTIARSEDIGKGAIVKYYDLEKGNCTLAVHEAVNPDYADDATYMRQYEWLNTDEGTWPKTTQSKDNKIVDLSTMDLDHTERKILSYIGQMRSYIEFDKDSNTTDQGIGRVETVANSKQRKLYIQIAKNKTCIRKQKLICECYYKDESKEKEADSRSNLASNPEKYTCKYIYDVVNATNLKKALILRGDNGAVTYTFSIDPANINLEIGATYRLISDTIGISQTYLRVRSITDFGGSKANPLCKVIAEGVQALSDITTDSSSSIRGYILRDSVENLDLTSSHSVIGKGSSETVRISASGLFARPNNLSWYLNEALINTQDIEISIATSQMVSGKNVIRCIADTGIYMGDKPLDSQVAVEAVEEGKDGENGKSLKVQYALGTKDEPIIRDPFTFGSSSFVIAPPQEPFGQEGIDWTDSVPSQEDDSLMIWERQALDEPNPAWQEFRAGAPKGEKGDAGEKGDFGRVGKLCFEVVPESNLLKVGIYNSIGQISDEDETSLQGLVVNVSYSKLGLSYINNNDIAFIAGVRENGVATGAIRPQIIKACSIGNSLYWCAQSIITPVPSDDLTPHIVFVLGDFKPSTGAYNIYETAITLKDASTKNLMQLLAAENMDNVEPLSEAMGFDAIFERIAVLEAFVNKLYANQITLYGSMQSEQYSEDAQGFPTNGFKLSSNGTVKAKNALLTFAEIGEGVAINAYKDMNGDRTPVLKTQYGKSPISRTLPPRTRWRGSQPSWICDDNNLLEGVCTYDGAMYTWKRLYYANGDAQNRLTLIDISNEAKTSRSFTIQVTGWYELVLTNNSYVTSNCVITPTPMDYIGPDGASVYLEQGVVVTLSIGARRGHARVWLKTSISMSGLYLTNGSDGRFIYDGENDQYLPSLVLKKNDNTVLWESDSYKVFTPSQDWVDMFEDGEHSDVTSNNVYYDGIGKNIISAKRVGNTLQLFDSNGQQYNVRYSANADQAERVNNCTLFRGVLTSHQEERGVLVDRLMPTKNVSDGGIDIGTTNNYFKTVYAMNVNDANSPSTAKVWRAVFN